MNDSATIVILVMHSFFFATGVMITWFTWRLHRGGYLRTGWPGPLLAAVQTTILGVPLAAAVLGWQVSPALSWISVCVYLAIAAVVGFCSGVKLLRHTPDDDLSRNQ